MLTDLAISRLSSKFTPAALKFPITSAILANVDFKIIGPKIGSFNTLPCHIYLIFSILVVVYLKIAKPMTKIKNTIFPPVPRIKSLACKMTAVGVGRATPIPPYISAKTGTTLVNIKTITEIATINITAGYINAPLIFFLIASFFSRESTSFNKKRSNLPLASPALIKLT